MADRDVTVIVHSRRSADLLPVSLSHLEIQTFPAARFEILIVDHNPGQATEQILTRYADGAPVWTRRVGVAGMGFGESCRLAVEEASGRWLVFLAESLLAGPHLIESHVQAQESSGGSSAVVGRILLHPQTQASALSQCHPLDPPALLHANQPLRYLDWRTWNLSLPRAELLEAGSFDGSFELDGLGDVEAAFRLEHAGVRGFYSEDACAYVWRAAQLAHERAQCYADGYTLHTLMQKTESDLIRERFARRLGRWGTARDTALAPVANVMCRALASDTKAFRAFHRSVMTRSFVRGYRDAESGRPWVMPE
ncbi:MAG: glycosyltransferase family 2 protein [bacterium]|nr:glycosyltransferase family 2 protein [bacterium]